MKIISLIFLLPALLLISCSPSQLAQFSQPSVHRQGLTQTPLQEVVIDPNFSKVVGQTIYVPIYSYIYYENSEKSLDLAATLSIRNTDLTQAIILTSARYYDTAGNLLKEYLEKPVKLQRLASLNLVVNRTDRSGGAGANFIVEWVSDKKVSEPLIEAVMISAVGNQSISFVSHGKVIKHFP